MVAMPTRTIFRSACPLDKRADAIPLAMTAKLMKKSRRFTDSHYPRESDYPLKPSTIFRASVPSRRCSKMGRTTSESGQSRRFDAPPASSGLPQSTDIARPARLVRFVPTKPEGSAGMRPRQLHDSVAGPTSLTFRETAMYQPKVPITSADEVKAILGPDFPNQIAKV